MIDCGSASAFRWSVLPYFRSRGVNELEGLFLTHGDSHHLGGGTALLNALPVNEVFDSPYRDRSSLRREIHTFLAEKLAGKAILRRGDTVTLGPGITLHVLYPPDPLVGLRARASDDKALILRLDLETGGGKTVRVLFTSDAGFFTEHWLLENLAAEELGELRADLLIKGMHAGDLSGTPEFLDAVNPRLVVACSAEYPAAQRVKEAWAASLETRGIKLLRQEWSGAVRIAIARDGEWTAQGLMTDEPALRSSTR